MRKKRTDYFPHIEAVINELEQSKYRDRYKIYPTFVVQGEHTFANKTYAGKALSTWLDEMLMADELDYFAYIKFFLDGDGRKRAIIAGKSGSIAVNSKGIDLNFQEYNPDPATRLNGPGRKWLHDNDREFCETMFLIVRPEKKGEDSEKEAEEIEMDLTEKFGLFGS